MTFETDRTEPVLASVEALRRFFLRQLNTQLTPVWDGGPGEDSVDYVPFEGPVTGIGLHGMRANRLLTQEERGQIADMFQTILGGMLALRERLAVLRGIEANLAKNAQDIHSNVVPLHRPQNRSNRAGHVFLPKDNRWILKLDCLIESPSQFEIAKMARELHDHSQRMVFIEISDLTEQQRCFPDDFSRLGAITVFVPDIFSLTRNEQFSLSQVLRTDATHRPLLMVGTRMPYGDLKEQSRINQDFLSLISRAYLKLTKPVAHYKSEGLFRYFLDSLT